MGKIRVAALGDQQQEQEKRDRRDRQREEKKKREKVHVPGMKGGERTVAMTSEEEVDKLAKISEEQEKVEQELATGKITTSEEKKGKKAKKTKPKSKSYVAASLKVDRSKTYVIAEALKLLREVSLTKFDATVELHINTIEKGVRGTVSLPHGTGKKIRIVILSPTSLDLPKDDSLTVGGDELITKFADGWTDFDVLISHPSFMPKLAKVARILGPKGLMPNPKAGTITDKPEKLAASLSKGQIQFKTESEFPIIHQVIGKLSFKDEQLGENYKSLVGAIGTTKIKSVTLKSTMSPGIRVQV